MYSLCNHDYYMNQKLPYLLKETLHHAHDSYSQLLHPYILANMDLLCLIGFACYEHVI